MEAYRIGIICALDSELAAIEGMLDEEHPVSFKRKPQDNNSYSFGRIHQHNVVIACLPAGTDGTAAAATVARDMIRTFPWLRFGLLVGTGGGIPNLSTGADIRLGDVVVSHPEGTSGGVIQYDKGKSLIGGGWERKGSLNKPPAVLLTTLQRLKAKHRRTRSMIPSYLAEMLEKYPDMTSSYGFPGLENDRLFDSSYHHASEQRSCEICDVQRVVSRPQRHGSVPQIHYGVIASGNKVVKDPEVRDFLRDDCKALCVEMEAAGLMNEFPCLVIRGICDYADSHKNNGWQEYAAAVAAGFAKEILLLSSSDEIETATPLHNIFGKLTNLIAAQTTRGHREDVRLCT